MMRHGIADKRTVLDEIFMLRKAYVDQVYLSFRSPETEAQEQFILEWKKGQ
jgi:hypothetical protein